MTSEWDVERCPARPLDPHDPEPYGFRDWLTPESIEVLVRCTCCGVQGVVTLNLRLGLISPIGQL